MYRAFSYLMLAGLVLAVTSGVVAQELGQGNILFEYWWDGGINQNLDNLKAHPDFLAGNSYASEWRQSLDRPDVPWTNYFGVRARGYLTPPETGDYTFWIYSNDQGQLWLSPDEDPANAIRIAQVIGSTLWYQWDKYPDQESSPIPLTAGRRYYIDALYADGDGPGIMGVGWSGSVVGSLDPMPIGSYLTPFIREPEPLLMAQDPDPEDGALHSNAWVVLSWKPGPFAVSHDVYFGDNSDDVNDGTSDTFRGNHASTSLVVVSPVSPERLVRGTTYYWRVDEVLADKTVIEGNVWIFSILPLTAHEPSPAHKGPAGVHDDQNVLLGWTAGFGALFHNVYFGDRLADVKKGTGGTCKALLQSETTFMAGPLEPGTSYYWRIDEFDGVTNYEGEVWSFTVLPKTTAYHPDPADGAELIDQNVTLSWTAGMDAILHTVYFANSFDDVNNAAGGLLQLNTTYTPGPLEPNMTYYWRVDEIRVDGTVQRGRVWDFTTMPVIAITDPNLVAWWRFDEGKGTVALDWSGHGNHATLFGPLWTTAGSHGGAALESAGGYLAIENLSYNSPGHSEVTVCAWVRTNSGADQYIVSFDRDEYWRLAINTEVATAGQVGWHVMTSAGQLDHGSILRVDDGSWHHICGVFDNGRSTIYIDGFNELSATGGTTYGSGNTRFGFIGANSEATSFNGSKGAGSPISGTLDDVRIYDRALIQEEILQVMRADPLLAWGAKLSDGSTPYMENATALASGTYRVGSGTYGCDDVGTGTAGIPEVDLDGYVRDMFTGSKLSKDTDATVTLEPGPFSDDINNNGHYWIQPFQGTYRVTVTANSFIKDDSDSQFKLCQDTERDFLLRKTPEPDRPVYRFLSLTGSNEAQYFCTADPSERDELLYHIDDWEYKGIAFCAAVPGAPNAQPVNRFWSTWKETYLYTIDPDDKEQLIDENSVVWELDKEDAFWAYPEAQPGTSAVYHFWSPSLERHFYTIDLSERNEKSEDENWVEQPVAWYVCDCINRSIDDDCDVDLVDFSMFADCWHHTDRADCGGADATGDSDVDFWDLVSLCDNWLAGL